MKKSDRSNPPRLAKWLLLNFVRDENTRAVIGDFDEAFKYTAEEKGLIAARKMYWFQTLRSIPSLLFDSGIWSIIMLQNYLKTAFRSFRKNKVHSLINIFGLSIGFACCILIYFFISDELSYDSFHKNADTIHEVYSSLDIEQFTAIFGTKPPLAPMMKSEFPEIVDAVRISKQDVLVRSGGDIFEELLFAADPSFFNMYTFPCRLKASEDPLSSIGSMVLTQKTSQKYFGNENPVGKVMSVRINDAFKDFTVSGVLQKIPENSSIKFDLLINIEALHGNILNDWQAGITLDTFIQLSPDADPDLLFEKFQETINKYADDGVKHLMQPFRKFHLDSEYSSWVLSSTSSMTYSYILAGIAVLVMLIACFNFMNLEIGNASARVKEIGIRKVVGAQRKQLVKQFWTQAVILCFAALVCGIILAELFLPVFNSLAQKSIHLDYIRNPKALSALIGITLLTGIIAGSYPALVMSRFSSVDLFRGKLALSGKNRLSTFLIVVQFSFSIFLIITTMFMYRQYDYMINKDLGFRSEQMMMVSLKKIPSDLIKSGMIIRSMKDRLNHYDNITSICGSEHNLTSWFNSTLFKDKDENQRLINYTSIDDKFFETLGINLVEGRNFSPEFPGDYAESIIVNETLVKELGITSPLDKRISDFSYGNNLKDLAAKLTAGSDKKIIGVVKDFHNESLHGKIRPTFLEYGSGEDFKYIFLRISGKNISETVSIIKKAFELTVPDVLFTYSFLDEEVAKQYAAEERWSTIINYSSFFAVLIACLGLFGLTMQTVVKKTKEIGIRKVLGASSPAIVRLVNKKFILLVLIANVIAWPAAYFTVEKILQNFAYRVTPGIGTYLFACGLSILLAIITVSLQSVKAARANPVDSLRTE